MPQTPICPGAPLGLPPSISNGVHPSTVAGSKVNIVAFLVLLPGMANVPHARGPNHPAALNPAQAELPHDIKPSRKGPPRVRTDALP
eukprot:14905066-Alexandrium_andersonii.AAC.1